MLHFTLGDELMKIQAQPLFTKLLSEMGPQGWWPARNHWEIILGAILVQNTNWRNVARSLNQLELATNLEPQKISVLPLADLQAYIRPSGFYINKSRAIQTIFQWLATYDFALETVKAAYGSQLRNQLLTIRGIGDETADVLLVYVFKEVTFIADKYAQKLFTRIYGQPFTSYRQLKKSVLLPATFTNEQAQEFHGLIVEFGKCYLKKEAAWQSSFLTDFDPTPSILS